ncbi:MAG: tyrosine protein phosphatase [bacterium]|nr:tyrosine protein phosphatase [bacterium]
MIDTHAHIIPGLDDGPDNMEIALEMLKCAKKDGIGTVVATPHTFSNLSSYENFEQLREAFKQFKAQVDEAELGIEILPGAENYFDIELPRHLKEYRDLFSINNSDYFLLEFPFGFVFPGSEQFIYNIMNDGFIPIICHPERNRVFRQDPGLLYRFMQVGALTQLTAGSLCGDFGTDSQIAALDLLKCNMVSMIASDSHHIRYRRPEMAFVYNVLDDHKEIDRKQLDILTHDAPLAITRNEVPPDTGTMLEPSQHPSFFDFIKKVFKK